MKKFFPQFIILLLIGFLVSNDHVRTLNIVRTPSPETQTQTVIASIKPTSAVTPSPRQNVQEFTTPTEVTPTPFPFPNLYKCNLEIIFNTGPLTGSSTDFFVLGEDYFADKGDRFFPGKNTAVYYDPPKYIILHSAFENGNMLKPLEAEFIRFYLEYWGESGNEFVQGNIDSLIGSSVTWKCDDEVIFNTTIREIVRLSQSASDRLWLEPQQLEQILLDNEGLVSEWIGNMEVTSEPTIYVGFCGWGPEDSGDRRFAYYRYLINFDLDLNP